MPEIGKAWIQIQPSMEGIQGSLTDLLGDESTTAGNAAGNKFGEAFKSVANVFVDAIKGAAGAGLDFLKDSVGVSMEFDSAMSQVMATMGYSVAELHTEGSEASKAYERLSDFAQEMGRTTAFSASEAAEALNYMALAGYDVDTSIDTLPSVLNLAAAGSLGLAEASDMVTDASSALGLTIDQTIDMVDQMAAASSSSNTSVGQLGDALLTVGGTAKNLAGGVLEASTALGILGDNGIKGGEGGTALRNIILSLAAPTDKAADAMAGLGLEVFDANGAMRPLNETFADLNGILSTMNEGERIQTLNTLFNKVDLKSVEALLANTATSMGAVTKNYKTNTAALQETKAWDTAVEKIKKVYEANGESLESFNEIEVLEDVWDTVAEVVDGCYGELSDNEALDILQEKLGVNKTEAKGLIEAFKEQVTSMDEVSDKLRDSGVDWDKYVGTLKATGTEIRESDLKWFANDIIESYNELGYSAEETATRVAEAWNIDLDDAILAVETLTGSVSEDGVRWDELTGKINDSKGAAQEMADVQLDNLEGDIIRFHSAMEGAQIIIAKGLMPELRDFVQFGTDAISELTAAFEEDGLSGVLTALGDIIAEGLALVISKLPDAVQAGMDMLMALLQGIIDNLPQVAQAAADIILVLANGLGDAMPEMIPKIVEVVMTIVQVLIENAPKLLEAGVHLIAGIAEGLLNSIPTLVEKIPELLKELIVGFATHAPLMLEAAVELILALATGLLSAIPDLIACLPEIVMALVAGLAEAVPQFIESGKQLIIGLGKGLIEAVVNIGEAIVECGHRIVQAFKDFFGIHSPSTVFAELGGMLIEGLVEGLKNMWQSVLDFFSGAWQSIVTGAEALVTGLGEKFSAAKDAVVAAWENVSDAFAAVWSAIQSVFEGVADWFRDIFTKAKEVISEVWEDVGEAFNAVWESIQEVFDGIADWFGEQFTGARDAAVAAWDAITDAFAEIWEAIQGAFDGVVEFFTELFTNARDAAADAWQSIVDTFTTIRDNIVSVYETLAEKMGEFFDAAKERAVAAWDNVKEAFIKVKDNVQSAFAELPTQMGQIFQKAKDAATNAWNDIKSKFQGVWKKIKEAFSLTDARQWGRDMIENFVSGIRSAISKVTDVVSNVASKVKNIVGFSEPKEGPLSDFHTYAPDMMSLFAEGIRDNTGIIQDALDTALEVTTPTIDVSRTAIIGAASVGTGDAITTSGDTTYNFYSPKALDPVTAMREARKASQRMAMAS